MELKERQKQIIEIVKANQPITSSDIASKLNVTRATIRPDLSILTMSSLLLARPKVGYFYNDESSVSEVREAINKTAVGDIQSLPVVADETSSVYDAVVNMFLEDVGSIFVISEGVLVGVVSRKDLLKACIGGADIHGIPIGVIMTRMPNVVMTHPDETVHEAAKKIIEHQVDSMPVVVDDGENSYKIVGRLSKTNITRLFVELGD